MGRTGVGLPGEAGQGWDFLWAGQEWDFLLGGPEWDFLKGQGWGGTPCPLALSSPLVGMVSSAP